MKSISGSLLILQILLVAAAPSWGPQKRPPSQKCPFPGFNPEAGCKEYVDAVAKLYLLHGERLNKKEPISSSSTSSIRNDNNNDNSHTWSITTTGDFDVLKANTSGYWEEKTDFVLHAAQNTSNISSEATGNLWLNDIYILWTDSSNETLRINGTHKVWKASGKTTILVVTKEGNQTSGFGTRSIYSVLETKHPGYFFWTTLTIQSLKIMNTSTVWTNHDKGVLRSHNTTGTWSSTTRGTLLPARGSTEQPNEDSADLHLRDSFDNDPLKLLSLENAQHTNWTAFSSGNFSVDGNRTVNWDQHSNTSLFRNHETKNWITFVNGSTEVSPIHLDVVFGTGQNSSRLEQPAITHSVWLEVSHQPRHSISQIRNKISNLIPKRLTSLNGKKVQLPESSETISGKNFGL